MSSENYLLRKNCKHLPGGVVNLKYQQGADITSQSKTIINEIKSIRFKKNLSILFIFY